METTPVTFLRGVLDGRVAANPRYSVRAFARDLRLSHSYVSQVLNERRGISLRTALRIASRLRLEPASRMTFIESLTRHQVDALAKEKPAARTPVDERVLEADYFHTVSSWYHGAIMELMTLAEFRSEARWIASRLGITPREAREGLERLARLGFARRENGHWRRSSPHFYFPNFRPSVAMQRYHLEVAEKAREALSSLREEDYGERDLTALTIAMDPARVPAARREIAKFRKRMGAFLAKGAPATEVYQLNIQLFPLTKKRKGKNRAR